MPTVRITWIDSVSPGVTGHKIYRDDVLLIDIPGMGVQTHDDTTALGGNTHKYEVQAYTATDETTDEVQGVNMDYISIAAERPAAPTVLAHAGGEADPATEIALSWTKSASGVMTEYRAYLNGVLWETFVGDVATGTVTGLTESTAYNNITVRAFDGSQESLNSNTINVTTEASGPDYGLGNATFQGLLTPPTTARSIEVANNKGYPAWAGIIQQWTITPADITTWTDDANNGTGYLNSIGDFRWNPDGASILLTQTDKRLFQYVINTPWDISARGARTEFDFATWITSNIRGFFTKPDGTKIYIPDANGGTLYQFSTVPGDLSQTTYDNKSFNWNPTQGYITGMCISPDGKVMLLTDGDDNNITVYNLSTPWDISTASQDPTQTLDVSGDVGNLPYSVRYNIDGASILVTSYLATRIGQYDLNN